MISESFHCFKAKVYYIYIHTIYNIYIVVDGYIYMLIVSPCHICFLYVSKISLSVMSLSMHF